MADDKKQTTMWLGAGGAAVVIIILIIWAVVGGPGGQEDPVVPPDPNGPEVAVIDNNEPVVPAVPGPRLADVIRTATTWMPAFQTSYGQDAPDFTLNDLAGNPHKLSDYKGKNVMLVFWATWCPPCKLEIPSLKKVRTDIGEDKLAILAISNEKIEAVKPFVATEALNYTVLLDPGSLPAPFNAVSDIPSSFFITPQGKIKLATQGLIETDDIKAIIAGQ